MGIANLISRRRAIYMWRRRIPKRADSGAANRQVLLRTACPWTALGLTITLTAKSEKILDQMGMDGLTPDVARQWLETVIRYELEDTARRTRAGFHLPKSGIAVKSAYYDRLAGKASPLVARKGAEVDLDEDERCELAARSYSTRANTGHTRPARDCFPDEQDESASISRNDLQRIFAISVWRGCLSAGRAREPVMS
ncbi:hypothetical protein [Paracoccus sediminilitoris]|uniref:hypothetical protein n=1 Tax=Paracoccus sediminilitoris TaxID=2202419 RepID=UPI00272BB603|nr:hypothetical protein [Paracoccus sediminilitoris]